MQAPNSGRRCSQLLGPEVESGVPVRAARMGWQAIGKNGLAQSAEKIIYIGQETRRMKALVGRSVVIAGALLVSFIVFSATPSIADSPFSQFRPQKQETKQNPTEVAGKFDSETLATDAASATRSRTVEEPKPLVAAAPYVATAYSLKGRTASGRMVSRGLIAADPRVLPLGSRVRLEVPGYHGEYLVADTGGLIKGKRIDIWIPTSREAMRFGRRTVKLTVLSYGTRRSRKTAKG
jgi:3D (Asp-Asp-Asp) domain-containing protein